MTTLPPAGLPKTIFKLVVDDPSTPSPLHPGEILREDLMPHLGLTIAGLADRLGVPVSLVNGLLEERVRVTPDLAIRLGEAFAQSPGYWRALQLQYDLWGDARGQPDASHGAPSKRDRRSA